MPVYVADAEKAKSRGLVSTLATQLRLLAMRLCRWTGFGYKNFGYQTWYVRDHYITGGQTLTIRIPRDPRLLTAILVTGEADWWPFRRAAAMGLAERGTESEVGPLVLTLLGTNDPALRDHCCFALEKIGERLQDPEVCRLIRSATHRCRFLNLRCYRHSEHCPATLFWSAVAAVLKREASYHEDHQTGEISKFGLSADFLRSVGLPHDRDSIRNLTLEKAIEIYREHWWEKYGFGRIQDQRLANMLFDLAVNLGPQRATKLLQQALVRCGAQLSVDGILGERTIAAVNEVPAESVLGHLRALAAEHYRTLAAKDPKYLPYLKGWLERASQ